MHLRRLLSYPELLTQKFLDLRSVTFSGNLLRLCLLFPFISKNLENMLNISFPNFAGQVTQI